MDYTKDKKMPNERVEKIIDIGRTSQSVWGDVVEYRSKNADFEKRRIHDAYDDDYDTYEEDLIDELFTDEEKDMLEQEKLMKKAVRQAKMDTAKKYDLRIKKLTASHQEQLTLAHRERDQFAKQVGSMRNRIQVLEKLLRIDTDARGIDLSKPLVWIRVSENMRAEEIYNLQNALDGKTKGTHILITRTNVDSIESLSDEDLETLGLMRIEETEAEAEKI